MRGICMGARSYVIVIISIIGQLASSEKGGRGVSNFTGKRSSRDRLKCENK